MERLPDAARVFVHGDEIIPLRGAPIDWRFCEETEGMGFGEIVHGMLHPEPDGRTQTYTLPDPEDETADAPVSLTVERTGDASDEGCWE